MTTVVIARKGAQVAIASDSLVTFGEIRLAQGYEANDKVFHMAGAWFGTVGTTAHFPVLRRRWALCPRTNCASSRATRCSRPS